MLKSVILFNGTKKFNIKLINDRNTIPQVKLVQSNRYYFFNKYLERLSQNNDKL